VNIHLSSPEDEGAATVILPTPCLYSPNHPSKPSIAFRIQLLMNPFLIFRILSAHANRAELAALLAGILAASLHIFTAPLPFPRPTCHSNSLLPCPSDSPISSPNLLFSQPQLWIQWDLSESCIEQSRRSCHYGNAQGIFKTLFCRPGVYDKR